MFCHLVIIHTFPVAQNQNRRLPEGTLSLSSADRSKHWGTSWCPVTSQRAQCTQSNARASKRQHDTNRGQSTSVHSLKLGRGWGSQLHLLLSCFVSVHPTWKCSFTGNGGVGGEGVGARGARGACMGGRSRRGIGCPPELVPFFVDCLSLLLL